MLNYYYNGFLEKGDTIIFSLEENPSYIDDSDFNKEDYELMQYTWLKDKNWKEIYEGDIVDEYWKKYQIHFDRWCFRYWLDTLGWRSQYFEIIWNIYENPNLLNND